MTGKEMGSPRKRGRPPRSPFLGPCWQKLVVRTGCITRRGTVTETYGFVYSGVAGVGIGIFRIADGKLVGTDLGGVRYRGSFVIDETTGEISLDLDQTVPAGVFLVQGTSPQDVPYIESISGKWPADFAERKPIEMHLPPGPVTLMVRRIPDNWSAHADGVNVSITPQTLDIV